MANLPTTGQIIQEMYKFSSLLFTRINRKQRDWYQINSVWLFHIIISSLSDKFITRVQNSCRKMHQNSLDDVLRAGYFAKPHLLHVLGHWVLT